MKVLFWMSTGFQTTSRHLLIAMLDELIKAGHSVTVLKKQDEEEIPAELYGKDIRYISIPVKKAKKSNLAARYFNDIKYISKCKKQLKSKYDAVFVQSTNAAGIIFRILKKKQPTAIKTLNVQDIFPYNASFSGKLKNNGLLFKLFAATQRYGYKRADHIITISEDMKDTLVNDGIETDKIEVIYNWSYRDEPYDNLDLSPVSHMFSKDYFNVVYAGNIGVMQNVDILIDAARLMKDDKTVWFHIIGNGVYKEKLEARANGFNITNISFWPMQAPELAPAIYKSADVNVIPLVKDIYRTALPSKTATCLACQSPIIFAIGKDSKFGQKVMKEAGCPVVETDNADELLKEITGIQQGKIVCNTSQFFLKNMSKEKNSHKYTDIITEI